MGKDARQKSQMEHEDVPECTDPEGHIWTSGRAEMNEEGVMVPVTTRCHICGFEVEHD